MALGQEPRALVTPARKMLRHHRPQALVALLPLTRERLSIRSISPQDPLERGLFLARESQKSISEPLTMELSSQKGFLLGWHPPLPKKAETSIPLKRVLALIFSPTPCERTWILSRNKKVRAMRFLGIRPLGQERPRSQVARVLVHRFKVETLQLALWGFLLRMLKSTTRLLQR